MPPDDSKPWQDEVYFKGNRLQATVAGETFDLAPVMGVGVSKSAWDNQIVPMGWRFKGYATYRRFLSEKEIEHEARNRRIKKA